MNVARTGLILFATLALVSEDGFGQAAPRGTAVLKTPPAGKGVRTPAPAADGEPPPAAEEDPMALMKQAAKEIEFKPKPGNFMVSFNLEDADLAELVKTISNITGRRFIYGARVKSIKATVYCPEKVSVQEAYSAFLSILETNGMTVVPSGKFLKIIETPGAASQGTPVMGPATPVPAEDRYVTRLYRLSHLDSEQVSAVLAKFKTKDGDISTSGNLLIITDTGTNIRRLLQLIEELDVGGAGEQLWIEPIHYAGAEEIAQKLNDILEGGTGSGGAGAKGKKARSGSTRIVADERTNSLVLTANEADYLRMLELIKRLDVPLSGEGEVHVLSLQHAACKELSQTLNTLLTGSSGASAGGKRGAAAGAAAGQPSNEEVFEGQIRVVCDEATNSLVVTSSLRDYAQLRGVVDLLDISRRQVFIEAVILDVGVETNRNLGVSFHGGIPFDTGGEQSVMLAGFDAGQSLVPISLTGSALGVRGPDLANSTNLTPTGVSIPAFGILLNALSTDNSTNVLSTPHLLATDNTPAEISVGENVATQRNAGGGLSSLAGLAGAAGGAGGAAGGLGALGALGALGGGFSAPRQDVGTKIKVTPHVNDSDQVRLEIEQEISEVKAGSTSGEGNQLGVVDIAKRTAKTTAIVKDQETIVIGGLVRDVVLEQNSKVPLLGDIPLLGQLFRKSTKQTSKRNLLLVITPHVVRSHEDLRRIFERKMQERQEFIDRQAIFTEGTNWKPPRDYARTNGLVEAVRQTQLEMARRKKLEEETRPRGTKTHEPGTPIALPTIGGGSSSGDPMATPDAGGGPGRGLLGGADAASATPRSKTARPPRVSPEEVE